MADAAAAPAATPKKAKKGGAKKTVSHPKYAVMIASAITALKERGGSSRQAILKYIIANNKVDEKAAATQLKLALKRGVASGALRQVKGSGASGSFRISKPDSDEPKVPKKRGRKPGSGKKPAAAKKAAAKKPAAKKAKKPAAKKSPKKPAAKKAAKKPAAKKAAKKPAAKKAAKKPAAKKAAKK